MDPFFILNIPISIKLFYTAFIVLLIPVYWKNYGPKNFLWFSDIALFTSAIAMWLENSLLASMMAVGVLLPELGWNIDYFGRLITGKKLLGLSNYMFEDDKSFFLRGLSLFHVFIPVILIWMLLEYGYHRDAIFYQTLLCWMILLICYLYTPPKDNINWVFGPGSKPQNKIPKRLYFLLLLLFFPLAIFLPTHLLLMWLFN
jgi:hypothetical protein